MKKNQADKCVLKSDAQDAINFINNVKTTLKVVSSIILLILFGWGAETLGCWYDDSIRDTTKHQAILCIYASLTDEQRDNVYKAFPDNSVLHDISRANEFHELELIEISKCLRNL